MLCRRLITLSVVSLIALRSHAEEGVPAAPPAIRQLKALYPRTCLAENGLARCVIVIPDKPGPVADSAGRLAKAIGEAVGVTPEIVAAASIVDFAWNVDVDAIAGRTPIALGNVNTNRLLAVLYGRRYVVADSLYPGKGGYVIRTVHDPFAKGVNVVALAGSDAAGVERACGVFIEKHLRADGSTLVLPEPIVDVVFTPESRPFFPTCSDSLSSKRQPQYTGMDWFRESWREAGVIDDAGNVITCAGEGTTRSRITGLLARMGQTYFRTGNRELLPLMKQLIDKNRAYLLKADTLHGMGGRTAGHAYQWDLLEELPIWTDRDRLDITNALLADAAIGHERRAFHRQAGEGVAQALDENHGTFSALRSFMCWQYFDTYYDLPETDYWLACADAVFSAQAGTYQILEDATGYLCYCPITSVAHALRSGNLRYFDRGVARHHARFIALACINNLGMGTGFGDSSNLVMPEIFEALAPAAWYHGDPRLYWIIRNVLPQDCGLRVFQNSIAMDLDVTPREPTDWTGLIKIPIFETPLKKGQASKEAVFAPMRVVDDTLFNKIIFKENWDRDGQYLLLDGAGVWGDPPGPHGHKHNDINTIINFTALDRMWLVDHTYQVRQYENHSGVYVTVDGRGGYQKRTLAKVLDLAELGDCAVSRTHFMRSDRMIVWHKGRHFLVLDKVTADEPGEYFARCSLRALGGHELRGHDLFLSQGDRYCKILTAGRGNADVETYRFTSDQWERHYPHAKPVAKIFQRDRKLTLEKGESFGFASLLVPYRSDQEADGVQLHPVSESCALIVEKDDRILAGTGRIPGSDDEAGVFVIGPDSVIATGVQSVCGGLLTSTVPCDVRIDVSAGNVTIVAPSNCELAFADLPGSVLTGDWALEVTPSGVGGTMALQAGKHVLTVYGWAGFDRAQDFIARTLTAAAGEAEKRGASRGKGSDSAPGFDGVSAETVSLGVPVSTLSVIDVDGEEGAEWLVTGASGVTLSTPQGLPLWHFATKTPVRTADIADTDGDGRPEIAVGCDDHNAYLLDVEGRLRWSFNCKASQGSADGAPAVDWVRIVDLEGDGKVEVVVGANWIHVLNADGSLRWERYMDLRRGRISGDFAAGAVADITGDGVKDVIGLFVTSYPLLQVYDAQGTMIVPVGEGKGHNGINIGVPVDVAVLDLDAPGGVRQVICATESEAKVVRHDEKRGEHGTGRLPTPCVTMACTQCGPDGAPLVVVATPMCGLTAATPTMNGESGDVRMQTRWYRNLGEKVTCLALARLSGVGNRLLLVVGTKQGNVYLLDAATGAPAGHARLHGAPIAALTVPPDGPGTVVAAATDGTVAVIRTAVPGASPGAMP